MTMGIKTPRAGFRLNPILLGVMVLWGFNFVAIKLLMKGDLVSPATAALARWIIMSLVLVVFCVARRLPLRYPKGEAWRIHLQGFLAMGVYMVLFTVGMHSSAAAEGAIILGCSPIFTLMLAVLLRQEPFRPAILLGTLLAFSGVALVMLGSPEKHVGTPSLLGNILIFVSAFVWAISAIVSKPLTAKVDPFVLTTLAMPGGLAALLPFGFMDFIRTDWAHLPLLNWSMLLYFSIGAGAIGFMGFYTGIKQVGAAGAMLYQYFVSPLAALSSWLVLDKGLGPWQLVGLGVVVTGVWLANRARNQASVSRAADAAS